MGEQIKRDSEKAARVKKVARITGYSEVLIYKVLDAQRENELVFTTYMNLLEAERDLENKLLKEVNNLVPFN